MNKADTTLHFEEIDVICKKSSCAKNYRIFLGSSTDLLKM